MKNLILTFLLCIFAALPSSLRSVTETVENEDELERAILSANNGTITEIRLGKPFTYTRQFSALNADLVLNPQDRTFTIDGDNNFLEADQPTQPTSKKFPGFFVRGNAGNKGSITIKDLIIKKSIAQGGKGGQTTASGGGGAGGGGLGAGGGLFLNEGSKVTLHDVIFEDCKAVGGKGGGAALAVLSLREAVVGEV